MKLLLAFVLFALVASEYTKHSLLTKRLDSKVNDHEYIMSLNNLYAAIGATKVYHCSTSNVDVITLATYVSAPEALATLQQSNLLEFAERDVVARAVKTPNDPMFNKLWSFNNTDNPGVDIHALEAWDMATGSETIVVAVIDTGADLAHNDLKANIWVNKKEIPDNGIDDDKNGLIDDYNGYNFNQNLPHPQDDMGHGTHCSGTIGAVGNNGLGIAGVNWKLRIMPLKFLNAQGSGQFGDAVRALDYAIKMGAHMSSNSYGGDMYSAALEASIRAAKKANHLFVCAAGNAGRDIDEEPTYPASYKVENVLAVAAHDNQDQMAWFSNFGIKTVPIAAPGVDIYSLAIGQSYQLMSGTSMACPHVAGIAALAASYNPALLKDVVKFRNLLASEKVVEKGSEYEGKVTTGGRINAAKVLKAAQQNKWHSPRSEQKNEREVRE